MSQGGHGESNPLGADNMAEAGGERSDGRPEGVPSPSGTEPDGRPAKVEEATPAGSSPADAAPTEAPEEQGEEVPTEHSPGSDL
ncbi:MAG: hypothetical protein H0V87_06540 [Chloroflexi bacterium]|nr:hypothetical protein [Chloroflexota bacterium]